MSQVERHREHLINYIIFLRITPFLPNWFINITSPVINVPLKVFFIGTFLGKAKASHSSDPISVILFYKIQKYPTKIFFPLLWRTCQDFYLCLWIHACYRTHCVHVLLCPTGVGLCNWWSQSLVYVNWCSEMFVGLCWFKYFLLLFKNKSTVCWIFF